jgi:fumarate reductase subunit C
MPIFWWLRQLSYARFIARELTSVVVAYAAVLLLVELRAISLGPEAFDRFTAWLRSPIPTVLHVFALAALIWHALTWLHLAPRALVVRLGGRRLPDAAVLLGHYAAWIAASALLLWAVLSA